MEDNQEFWTIVFKRIFKLWYWIIIVGTLIFVIII